MAQVGIRIDDKIKKEAEQACSDMGLSLSAAITVFLTKVAREKRIPFEINADPFYSENNIKHLEKIIGNIESGKANLVEHDLIEME